MMLRKERRYYYSKEPAESKDQSGAPLAARFGFELLELGGWDESDGFAFCRGGIAGVRGGLGVAEKAAAERGHRRYRWRWERLWVNMVAEM